MTAMTAIIMILIYNEVRKRDTMDINELSTDRMEFSVLYRYGLIDCVLNIELKMVKLSNMYFQKKKHKLCSIEFLRICFARSNF